MLATTKKGAQTYLVKPFLTGSVCSGYVLALEQVALKRIQVSLPLGCASNAKPEAF